MLLDLYSLETPARSFAYVASGGITFSGATTYVLGKAYAGSGGIAFGGTGVYQLGKVYAASGGITFGGVGTYTLGEAYPGSGGIAFGGGGAYAYGAAYVGSGGIVFSGTAPYALLKQYLPTGGIVFSGTADYSFVPASGAATYTYVASGGIIFSGVAVTSGPAAQQTTGGGGGTAGGYSYRARHVEQPRRTRAAKPRTYEYVGAGGIVFSDKAATRFAKGKPAATVRVSPRPAILVAREVDAPILAPVARQRAYVGSGGLRFGGAAQCGHEIVWNDDEAATAFILALAA